MQWNKDIPFTASWKATLIIGMIMGAFVALIIVLLQPFDTYGSEMPYKHLKLAGYSLCVLTPILVIHFFEYWRFRTKGRRWLIPDEVVTLLAGTLFLCLFSFVYNHLVVNELAIEWASFPGWALTFGLPFAPLYLPLWAFLRYRFGKVEVKEVKEQPAAETLTVKGRNLNEVLRFERDAFVMAHAQANYVDVYLLQNDHLQKHTLRAPISEILEQLPHARQVHRSYLINQVYVLELEGNSRKGAARLAHVPEAIPVSPKHFTALKNNLHFHPKSSN